MAVLRVNPLTPTLGAEIGGVDLSQPLNDVVLGAVHGALLEHQVIFFRDQQLSPASQVALGKRFGVLQAHPVAPHIDGYPELMRIHTDEHSARHNGADWHTDLSCEPNPPMGSILYLTTVPDTGGDTLFASMYAAYDALSPAMQRILEPLRAVHESEAAFGQTYREAQLEQKRERPRAVHPVVQAHPETGRKALYVNPTYTTCIEGLALRESDALLGFLCEHLSQPRFQCRFSWRPNSVAFWDNRCVQHLAIWDYFPQSRSGARVTIARTPD